MIRLLFLFQFLSIYGFCQEPTHFYIGQNELANIHIYSIIQSNDLLIYVATDQGVLVYKHGEFKPIKRSPVQHGSSLFSLTQDSKGHILCCNLQGQVFKVINGELKLYNTIPKKDLARRTSIEFDDQDHLVVLSKSLFWMSEDSINYIFPDENRAFGAIQKYIDGRINIPCNNNCSILIQNGVPTIRKHGLLEKYPELKSNYYPRFDWYVDNETISFFNSVNEIKASNGINVMDTLAESGQYNLLPDLKGEGHEMWVSKSSSGLFKFILDSDTLRKGALMFEKTFISNITRGVDGTLLLGTFNKGVIVIPNENTLQYDLPDDDVLKDLVILDDHSLVASAQSGHLYKFDGEFKVFDTFNFTNNPLFYVPGFNFGTSKEIPGLYMHGQPDGRIISGSVKDIEVIDSTILFASATSISRWGNFWDQLPWTVRNIDSTISETLSHEGRYRNIVFDKVHRKLHISTSSDLFTLDSSGVKQNIRDNNKPIFVNYMIAYKDLIICATQQRGLVFLQNGVIKKTINTSVGLESNYVSKVIEQGGKLYISHQKGIQIYDMQEATWKKIGAAEGIMNGSVTDFELDNGLIWVISNGSLVLIDSQDLTKSKTNLKLHLDEVQVQNHSTNKHVFPGHNNHLSFLLEFRGIEYQTETQLYYRLKGLEHKWTRIENTNYPAEYRSLPPGEYIFEAKAVYRGEVVSKLTYDIKIEPLFWQTTWFLILVFVLFTIVSWFIYRIYDKRKSRKEKMINELNASKLIAIQSQMNPHFIFNALNSIQELVLNGSTEEAYTSITKFANLVRRTLNYSERDFIEIQEEIKLIELYLALEKLRFKTNFDYTINSKIEGDVLIPPMIVQPLIENALVHGLLHKKGKRNLIINYCQVNEMIECVIEDNGIGREAAKTIRKRQNPNHDSFSVRTIKNRLNILSEQSGFDLHFKYEDLYDNDMKASGTRVTFRLPIKTLY